MNIIEPGEMRVFHHHFKHPCKISVSNCVNAKDLYVREVFTERFHILSSEFVRILALLTIIIEFKVQVFDLPDLILTQFLKVFQVIVGTANISDFHSAGMSDLLLHFVNVVIVFFWALKIQTRELSGDDFISKFLGN
jgi:hypothetical protein